MAQTIKSMQTRGGRYTLEVVLTQSGYEINTYKNGFIDSMSGPFTEEQMNARLQQTLQCAAMDGIHYK